MMKKQKRKLSRKFKRTVGFSIAGLFLISAIIVALIPQKNVSAYTSTSTVYLTDTENQVPTIADTDKIYTTGDGMFQFAYIYKKSGANKVAVICGYDFERSLSGGNLTIPDTVDAYTKYTDAFGTSGGYVAVSKNDEPLFYPTFTTVTVQVQTGTDDNGDPVYEEQEQLQATGEYLPCYYNTISQWEVDENGNTREPEKYYYYDSSSSSYLPCLDEVHKRITDATVNYIANQNVVKTDSGWVLSATDSDGIFSNAKNIVNLTLGEQILGIGNYAFANCANLSSVTFNDGLNTIGNYAFAECHNLKTVNLPENAAISTIGERAFYNCQGLQTFTLPTGVLRVGDSCFEGCVSMTECVIDIPDKNMALNEMGTNVFKNCSSLEEIEFPVFYNEDQDVSWFEGCTSLKHITIPNTNMTITDSTSFSFTDFQDQLPVEFYLEGVKDQNLHKTSTANSFAFKYLDEEIYEKVYTASGDAGSGKTVFQVNNNNELIYFHMDDTVLKVQIPEKIGPYGITVIGSDSFAGKHKLSQITIPSTITEIEADAFKGCHSLENVIFEEPINISLIGDGAFDTQTVDPLIDTCTLSQNPVLTFTGVAKNGSAPFDYAMDPDNNINNADQPRTYITFYTGWPTNLTVQYNPEKSENELIDCPTLTSIATLDKTSYPYMTDSYVSAASTAYSTLQSGGTLTDNQKAIINSALNVNLPDGITAIKDGLFSGYDTEGNSTGTANTDLETITIEGVKSIDAYAFKDMDTLKGVYINNGTESLGDYAFEDCDSLADVDIYSDLTEFKKVPFIGCEELKDVDFGTNKNFTCADAIIYGLVNGKKDSILEVLASRGLSNGYGSGSINPSEFSEVSSIAEEAFKDCDGILSVDLSQSDVKIIPESCFEDTDELYSVILKDGNNKIGPNAFKNSNIRYVSIPNSTSIIDNTAFDGDSQQITFYAEEESPAAYYAANYSNIIVSEKPVQYHVYFYDEDTTTLLDTQLVDAGSDATTYVTPSKTGYVFDDWYPSPVNVTADLNTYARYSKEDEITYEVKYINYDDSVFATETVVSGEDCEKYKTMKDPERDGYKFTGWLGNLTAVTENREVYAQFEEYDPDAEFTVKFYDHDDTLLSTQTVKAGEDCIEIKEPKRDGYTFTGWKPAITAVTEDRMVYAQYEKNTDSTSSSTGQSGSSDASSSGTDSSSTSSSGSTSSNATLYTVTVVDGTGSGSYASGANVVILADNPDSGKVFDKWVVDDGVSLLKADLAANYFKMPAKNVTVKATYKEDSSKSSTTNNSSGTTTTTSNVVTPNTSVSLTKTGFSNNGLASASVTGSSDNYVLKITDSQTAKAEIEDALLSKYDSLDNIKYVAMDISLYDSTGSAKIENSSDLKVSVTVPIPDDLVTYAGNNKVAYAVNGKLVDLNAKFTTINNVPCINFVAPHFSPYTIYVDTNDLSSSVTYTSTSTPKTGDGLSVKWYISIGLFAASIVFFALCIPTGKKKKVRK